MTAQKKPTTSQESTQNTTKTQVKVQEPEAQEPETQEPEAQEPEVQEPVVQEPEVQEPEQQINNTSEKPKYPLTHTIQKGDTLGKISERYYGTHRLWKHIADYNNIAANKLRVGQDIKIPAR